MHPKAVSKHCLLWLNLIMFLLQCFLVLFMFTVIQVVLQLSWRKMEMQWWRQRISRHAMGCFNSLWLTRAVRGVLAVRSGWGSETFRNAVKKNGLVNFLVVTGHLYIENIFHSKQWHPWLDTMAESKGHTSSALELAHARSGWWPTSVTNWWLCDRSICRSYRWWGLILNLLNGSCHEKLRSHRFLMLSEFTTCDL